MSVALLWLTWLPFAGAGGAGFETGENWYELQTGSFAIYSSAPTQEVARLAARLEQFRQAYSLLSSSEISQGTPIVVMAFPDQDSLQPYLGFTGGKQDNAGGFFLSDREGSMIALSLSQRTGGSLHKIYHEYAHYLFRGNNAIWPLWLKEGMAEIYSTFDVSGSTVTFAHPIRQHLLRLRSNPSLSLERLLEVQRDSSEYNEIDHQGIFYAKSWLLAHYLITAGNGALRPRLAAYTRNLQAGQEPVVALTNALGLSLLSLERQLGSYLAQTNFGKVQLPALSGVSKPRNFRLRSIGYVESSCRLGDQLRRIRRLEDAAACYGRALAAEPRSGLPQRGLGLLASARNDSASAVAHLAKALDGGVNDAAIHYAYALELLGTTRVSADTFVRLEKDRALEIRGHAEKAIRLAPNMGAAHQLLGFLEMLQGGDLKLAERHLQIACRLEPDDLTYVLSLAQVQAAMGESARAKATLVTLLRPNQEPEIRVKAQKILALIEGQGR